MQKEMVEYIIFTEPTIKKVRDIYDRFLRKDDKWFFHNYDNCIKLRTSCGGHRNLRKYFYYKKWVFEEHIFDYFNDADKVTSKYFDYFVNILHAYTIIILESNTRDRKKIIERCVHLLFNMFFQDYSDEAEKLAILAINRAFVAGKYSKPSRKRGI